MPDDPRVPRRSFFLQGFRELLKPLANATEPIERALRELDNLDRPAPPKRLPVTGNWLRPPGALDEQQFRETCSQCAACVSVCPASAIKLDSSGTYGAGFPFIVAAEAPCVACDGLHCMQNCPSGALVFTPLANIDMGTAVWHMSRCVRSHGEACTACIDQCPLGSAAIVLEENRIKVIEDGCIGCGVCEHYCPTEPKAITISPKSGRIPGAVSR